MATWANETKNSASWSNNTKTSATGISTGSPIGLLLALTYSADVSIWSNQTKSSSSWSNLTKN